MGRGNFKKKESYCRFTLEEEEKAIDRLNYFGEGVEGNGVVWSSNQEEERTVQKYLGGINQWDGKGENSRKFEKRNSGLFPLNFMGC